MLTRRNLLKLSAATLLGASLALPVHAAETIKIGTFLAVTGPASFLGDPELKTLQMYVEEINSKGGVLGKQLELVHYDSGANPKKAVNFVKRLIQRDRVDVIVGGSASGETLAVIPEVENAGIPFISLAGSIRIVEPTKKWVFKTPHTDRMAIGKIYGDMKKRGIQKVALISGDGGFDKSCREQALKLASAYGMSIVADESYGTKDTDMTAQLTKIRATDAQGIVNCGFGTGPAIVTKNVRQLGIDVPLYQSHGVTSKKFIELAGDAAEGVRLPAAALLVAEKLPDSDPQKPVLMDYKSKYESKYGPVSTFGGHAYDGLMIAVEAIKRAGSTDKEAVRAEIEKTKGFIGTGGVFSMNANDHLGLTLDAFKMLEIKNGDWTLVE
ncbi:MAG: ABC transporter substrate-binding protein [Gammaproteobacteria bacterium]